MDYFEVVNWKDFQHHQSGDRALDPPWIKLYRRLLENYEFACLPDASKWHLIGIFLVNARHRNRLPHDEEWLTRETRSTSRVKLQPLFLYGFIAKIEDASDVLADGKQNAALEEEEEEEKEPPISPADAKAAFTRFWDTWPRHHRKADRKRCFEKWRKDELTRIVDRIVASVESHKACGQWREQGGKYIPAPLVWLNRGSWEAPVDASTPTDDSPGFERAAPLSDDEALRLVRGEVA